MTRLHRGGTNGAGGAHHYHRCRGGLSPRGGVGTALLLDMEQRLAGSRRSAGDAGTATSNEAGVAFWQRHGYRTTGFSRGYYLGRLDAYSMVKALPWCAPSRRAAPSQASGGFIPRARRNPFTLRSTARIAWPDEAPWVD